MNPFALFFGLLLLAGSVFFVVSPFRSPATAKKSTSGKFAQNGSLKVAPETQRQAVLLALRDLDFDYQAGKVAEEDYQSLRASLLTEAAALMQAQERQKDDSIEALIQSRRQARAVSATAKNGKAAGEKVCQHCHASLKADAKFCSKCGKPVVDTTCPKCNHPVQPGDRFCPTCGSVVSLSSSSTEKESS